MAETFPATIPQSILRDGFNYDEDQQFIESDMQVGPPKVRRTSTTAYKNITGNLVPLTQTQISTFLSFYNTTLSGGTKYFNFDDPVSGTSGEYRFVSPPVITSNGPLFLVRVEMKGKPL